MSNECYRCTDYFEEDKICYVCYQQLETKINNLKKENEELQKRYLEISSQLGFYYEKYLQFGSFIKEFMINESEN